MASRVGLRLPGRVRGLWSRGVRLDLSRGERLDQRDCGRSRDDRTFLSCQKGLAHGFGDRPGDPAVRPQSENENNHHRRHCEADKDVARTGERGCRKPGASHTNVTPCRRVPCRRPFYERWISEPTSSLARSPSCEAPLAGSAGAIAGRAVGGLLIPAAA